MGTINRAGYVIAFLHEPGTPLPTPWTTGNTAWNRRLIYSFGGGCAAGYHQGRTLGGLSGGAGQMEEAQVGLGDYPIAKGYAAFRLLEMPTLLDLPQGTIQSTLLPHGGINTLGLLFTERSSGRRFAYYTDCKRVPHEAVELARGADALVLDGLRPTPHPSHLSIPEAVEVARSIGAKATWLTHLTHHTDHGSAEAELPTGIRFAHDGMRLSL
mgnify:CR=1 FL=1